MQNPHTPTLWGQGLPDGPAAGNPSQFSTFDTLTASLAQTQQRPLQRDLGFMAVVLMALTFALTRVA
jgi:hypothetical protein